MAAENKRGSPSTNGTAANKGGVKLPYWPPRLLGEPFLPPTGQEERLSMGLPRYMTYDECWHVLMDEVFMRCVAHIELGYPKVDTMTRATAQLLLHEVCTASGHQMGNPHEHHHSANATQILYHRFREAIEDLTDKLIPDPSALDLPAWLERAKRFNQLAPQLASLYYKLEKSMTGPTSGPDAPPPPGVASYTPLKQLALIVFNNAAYEPMKDAIDAALQSRLTPGSGVPLWDEADIEAFKKGNILLQSIYDRPEPENARPLATMPSPTNPDVMLMLNAIKEWRDLNSCILPPVRIAALETDIHNHAYQFIQAQENQIAQAKAAAQHQQEQEQMAAAIRESKATAPPGEQERMRAEEQQRMMHGHGGPHGGPHGRGGRGRGPRDDFDSSGHYPRHHGREDMHPYDDYGPYGPNGPHGPHRGGGRHHGGGPMHDDPYGHGRRGPHGHGGHGGGRRGAHDGGHPGGGGGGGGQRRGPNGLTEEEMIAIAINESLGISNGATNPPAAAGGNGGGRPASIHDDPVTRAPWANEQKNTSPPAPASLSSDSKYGRDEKDSTPVSLSSGTTATGNSLSSTSLSSHNPLSSTRPATPPATTSSSLSSLSSTSLSSTNGGNADNGSSTSLSSGNSNATSGNASLSSGTPASLSSSSSTPSLSSTSVTPTVGATSAVAAVAAPSLSSSASPAPSLSSFSSTPPSTPATIAATPSLSSLSSVTLTPPASSAAAAAATTSSLSSTNTNGASSLSSGGSSGSSLSSSSSLSSLSSSGGNSTPSALSSSAPVTHATGDVASAAVSQHHDSTTVTTPSPSPTTSNTSPSLPVAATTPTASSTTTSNITTVANSGATDTSSASLSSGTSTSVDPPSDLKRQISGGADSKSEAKVVEPPPPKIWSCPTCTYDNDIMRRNCEMCGAQRPPHIVIPSAAPAKSMPPPSNVPTNLKRGPDVQLGRTNRPQPQPIATPPMERKLPSHVNIDEINTPAIQKLRQQIEDLRGYKDDMNAFNSAVDLRLAILKGGLPVNAPLLPPATPAAGDATTGTATVAASNPSSLSSDASTNGGAVNSLASASPADTAKIDGIIASMI